MIDEPWDEPDEEPEVVRGPAHRRRKRDRDGGAGKGEVAPPERRRLAAIALVAVSLVAAGFASGAFHPPAAASVAPPAAVTDGGLPVVTSSTARSSAWYCPGPLPYGGGQQSVLVLTSSAGAPVSGVVTVSFGAPTGAAAPAHTTNLRVTVPAHASVRVPLTGPGRTGWVAASVLLDGGGVGVWQDVSWGSGSSTQSCQVTTSATWYLPAGSTARSANTMISLFNPTATTAVASLSFSSSFGVSSGAAISGAGSSTPSAPVAPAVFQGLMVGPGQLVVLDIGKQVQLRPELAATVTVTAGRLVSGAWSSTLLLDHIQQAVVDASPVARGQWWFPLAAAGPGPSFATGYWLYNPASTPAGVTLVESLAPGSTASTTLVVPAESLVTVSPPAAASSPTRHAATVPGWAQVDVAGDGTVVAAQGVFPAGTSRGSVGAVGIPQVSLGAPTPAAAWVVASPEAVPGSAASHQSKAKGVPSAGTLWIAAPEAADAGSVKTAVVTVEALAPTGSSGGAPVQLATVTVKPGTTQAVTLPATAGTLTEGLLVGASAPVVVGVSYAGGVSVPGLGTNGAPSMGTAVA